MWAACFWLRLTTAMPKKVDEKTGEPYTAHTVGKVRAVLVNDKQPVKGLKDGVWQIFLRRFLTCSALKNLPR